MQLIPISGYRMPRPQGRSASGSPPPQDVGSGRDFMKKFMMMRGLFQQPPSDNIIVISQPSTSTTTTTPTPTTTTTTTTTTTNATGRALNNIVEPERVEPQQIAVGTFTGLEDRLDLPQEEAVEPQEVESFKQRKSPKFQLVKLKTLQPTKSSKGTSNSRAKKNHHRRRYLKKNRHQKRHHKKTKKPANQNRSSESSANFIEPYHNERSPDQTGQSGSDSRLQRIWRRFQLAN
ncbi:hypothetical protein KR009_009815 [Drosophila setifemur]|nr:hypothetical protein KR009_009815 [Drosophila setifemur]